MNALADQVPPTAVDDEDDRFPMQKHPCSTKAFRAVVPAFLELFAISCNISASARKLGFHSGVVRELAKADPVFEERLELARIEATDALEGECRRRAMYGVKKLVTHKGFPVLAPKFNEDGEALLDAEGKVKLLPLYEVVYSDRLAELLLRGHRPERFTKKQDHMHEINSKVGVLVVPERSVAAEWAARVEASPKPGELPAAPSEPIVDAVFTEEPEEEDDGLWLT